MNNTTLSTTSTTSRANISGPLVNHTVHSLIYDNLATVIFHEIIGFIILFTNSILVYLILSHRRLRKSNHNIIIVSMSTGCIIYSIFYCLFFPFNVISLVSVNVFCPLFGPFRNFCLAILNLHLCLVGIEKYLLIVYSLNVILTRKSILVIACIIWIVGFFISFIPIFTYRPYNPAVNNGCIRISSNRISKELIYFIVFYVIIFLIPLIVMLYCYGYICFLAIQHIRRINSHDHIYSESPDISNRIRLTRKNLRAAKPFIIMVGTFLLTWLPSVICNIIMLVIPYLYWSNIDRSRDIISLQGSVVRVNVDILRNIASAYIAVIPIIYGYFNPEIRKVFYSFVGCKAAAANMANPTSNGVTGSTAK